MKCRSGKSCGKEDNAMKDFAIEILKDVLIHIAENLIDAIHNKFIAKK